MAPELGLLSLRSQQNQHQQNSIPWMWNPNNQTQEDDDSWEVKAFEEDTSNIMGTTWPPRSYTCTFCRREFRSAQALGGHMNVHRRDRARLHHQTVVQPPPPPPSGSSSSSSTTFLIPTQEFSANGTTSSGLCLLYQLPNPNGVFTLPTTIDHSPSTLLSISPYPHNYPLIYSTKPQSPLAVEMENNNNNCKELVNEEVDLELRLGHRSTKSSSTS